MAEDVYIGPEGTLKIIVLCNPTLGTVLIITSSDEPQVNGRVHHENKISIVIKKQTQEREKD